MGVSPNEPTHEENRRKLDYAGSTSETGRSAADVRRRRVAVALGLLWPLAMMMAGTSSDRVRIPLDKKIALTSGGAICVTLLFVTSGGRRLGCAFAFLIVAMWLTGVMWFWN